MRGVLSFLLGFTLVIAVNGTLTSCKSGGGNSTPTYTYPYAYPGQWIAYGGNENQVQGGAINFNCCNAAAVSGYYYTKFNSAPQIGQILTLTYTLTGNNPVFQQVPAGGGNSETDSNPPTNSLLIWQAGDNLSCQGDYNFYRLFPRSGKTNLTLGTHTIAVPLTGASWQGCYPNEPVTDARLQAALNNLAGIGFTFGGQMFDGHGVYLSSGSATFTINSFTVQ